MAVPRRFKPELLETTTSSSSSSSSSSFSTLPPRKPRRFMPQLVESSTRRGGNRQSDDDVTVTPQSGTPDARKTRRFAPQLVDTTSRHSGPPAHACAVSEPVSKSMSSSATSVVGLDESDEDQAPLLPHERMTVTPVAPHSEPKPPSRARRRFTPQLIETAKRSHRAGDAGPALLPSDKTNVSPGDATGRPRPTPLPPQNISQNSLLAVLKPYPLRQGSIRPHYTTRANTRQHSYKIPDLEDIDSSCSEAEDQAPSLSRCSSFGSSDEAYKHATRLRESVDDRFSGYLLALAARAAEKQLREQEAAAFATSDFHEPVAHYVDDDAEEDMPSELTVTSQKDPTRRDSADERWALHELQLHGERMRQQSKATAEKIPVQAARKKTAGVFNVEFDEEASQDAWATPAVPKNMIGGYQKDPDLKQMRKAASPPMLGGDIDFPRCPSPEHARFDVTQGSDFLKASMCYLTEQGLWGGIVEPTERPKRLWDCKDTASNRANGGLWGGFCTPKDTKLLGTGTQGIVTPIRTPLVERDDPFSLMSLTTTTGTTVAGPRATGGAAPPSPPASNSGANDVLEERSAVDAQVDAEFDDAFVTQVYNYLSLGYPALARKFDQELSKISKFDIEDLRCDDKLADVHGYLRLGEDEITAEIHGVQHSECRRWLALKVYIHEWGKQMALLAHKPGMPEDPHRAWGLPARKGSWAL